MGVCGLHTTVAELDQSSVPAIVATWVGTDYIALNMITILMTQKYVLNLQLVQWEYNSLHEFKCINCYCEHIM